MAGAGGALELSLMGMTSATSFDLPVEDALVFEPPSLSEACDPRGEPFEAPKPGAQRPARRWLTIAAIVIGSVFATVALAFVSSKTYAFSWLEEDGSVSIADVRWPYDSQLPIERVSLRLEGENLDVLDYEITPQPRFLPRIESER